VSHLRPIERECRAMFSSASPNRRHERMIGFFGVEEQCGSSQLKSHVQICPHAGQKVNIGKVRVLLTLRFQPYLISAGGSASEASAQLNGAARHGKARTITAHRQQQQQIEGLPRPAAQLTFSPSCRGGLWRAGGTKLVGIPVVERSTCSAYPRRKHGKASPGAVSNNKRVRMYCTYEIRYLGYHLLH
jgi:hypothetical protein